MNDSSIRGQPKPPDAVLTVAPKRSRRAALRSPSRTHQPDVNAANPSNEFPEGPSNQPSLHDLPRAPYALVWPADRLGGPIRVHPGTPLWQSLSDVIDATAQPVACSSGHGSHGPSTAHGGDRAGGVTAGVPPEPAGQAVELRCVIEPCGKFRHGAPRGYCRVHGCHHGYKDDQPDRCRAAGRLLRVCRQPLLLDLQAYSQGPDEAGAGLRIDLVCPPRSLRDAAAMAARPQGGSLAASGAKKGSQTIRTMAGASAGRSSARGGQPGDGCGLRVHAWPRVAAAPGAEAAAAIDSVFPAVVVRLPNGTEVDLTPPVAMGFLRATFPSPSPETPRGDCGPAAGSSAGTPEGGVGGLKASGAADTGARKRARWQSEGVQAGPAAAAAQASVQPQPPLEVVRCKACGTLHCDLNHPFDSNPHKKHLCHGCGRDIVGRAPNIGNPAVLLPCDTAAVVAPGTYTASGAEDDEREVSVALPPLLSVGCGREATPVGLRVHTAAAGTEPGSVKAGLVGQVTLGADGPAVTWAAYARAVLQP